MDIVFYGYIEDQLVIKLKILVSMIYIFIIMMNYYSVKSNLNKNNRGMVQNIEIYKYSCDNKQCISNSIYI